ncbi:MAG: primosomal protein N' [Nitrospira sp.]|nr:primosomal protein N' [Nitrospira sp.]
MITNVIEFHMNFFDIIFPLNIGPLTYRCPDAFLKTITPGMAVSAPLKNKITKGIVMGISPAILSGNIKEIQDIHGDSPVLSDRMVKLLKWMSEYYIAEQGLVLKNMLPKEAFTSVKKRKTKVLSHSLSEKLNGEDNGTNVIKVNNNLVADLIKSFKKETYKTFLLHAPSSSYEDSLLTGILSETSNVIILVPEVCLINNLYILLNRSFGERVCLLHSELSRGQRSESIGRILSGHSDIVLGTRSAVFAPLKKVSFIAVLHEHSSSYKQENSPCYNARDVAVMRGYLEKAVVLLSSISPSIESFYNCRSGKYTLLNPSFDIKTPKVKVIDMRYEKHIKPYLSKTITDAAAKHIKNDKKIIFAINRRGHSTLLQCMDCSHIEECPACRIPMVFHKQDMSMKCHYCGYTLSKVPESCSKCKGYNIQLLGAGTQRVQEDLEALLGIKALRLDSDRAKNKSEVEALIGATFTDANRIFIGTKLMTKRLGSESRFAMAAILNTDLYLNLPDFRSAEKSYQEILSIIDKIDPDGEVFIQTRMPQNYLYKCLKNYDYNSFFKEELQRRRDLSYPPFSKLLLIKFITRRDISGKVQNIKKPVDDVEILGPYIEKNKKGENEYKLLLKSSLREKLHSTAKSLLQAFKNQKDVKIKVDVDPVKI